MLILAGNLTFWTAFLALATLIGAGALITAFIVGGSQLLEAKKAAQQQAVSGQEEMLLRFSAVYHDMMPPKRRITAMLLFGLVFQGDRVADADRDSLNALADVMRFFESVRFAIESAHASRPKRDRSSPGLLDPLAMEFGRYAAGYGSALSELGGTKLRALVNEALPLHAPSPQSAVTFVNTTLAEITRHAKEAQDLVIQTHQNTSGLLARFAAWLKQLFDSSDGRPTQDSPFPGWGRDDVKAFLCRELVAQRAQELSRSHPVGETTLLTDGDGHWFVGPSALWL